jgi:hypothetical protein
MLEAGKQGKHIVGHNNFITGRSIFSHSDPQGLLDKFAGAGARISGAAGCGERAGPVSGTGTSERFDQTARVASGTRS